MEFSHVWTYAILHGQFFFNVDKDMAQILLTPTVDALVAALYTLANLPGVPEDALKPKDKRVDLTLQRGHQAAAWAVKASTTTSFFIRSCLLWLQNLQQCIPIADIRAHQNLNKVVVAVRFTSDATLTSAKFAARVMSSSVAACRLFWLHQWQADVHHK